VADVLLGSTSDAQELHTPGAEAYAGSDFRRVNFSLRGQSTTFELALQSPTVSTTSSTTSSAGVTTLVGSPTFNGPFVVRYSDYTQWEARAGQIGASWLATPEYARAQLFHTFLLAKMSHEKVGLPGLFLQKLAPVLASSSVVKSLHGPAASLYQLAFKELLALATPLGVTATANDDTCSAMKGSYAQSDAVGPVACAALGLIWPLLDRLKEEQAAGVKHEDDVVQLHADALFWAVYYENGKALTLSHSRCHTPCRQGCIIQRTFRPFPDQRAQSAQLHLRACCVLGYCTGQHKCCQHIDCTPKLTRARKCWRGCS
jgi:hypothetical protein